MHTKRIPVELCVDSLRITTSKKGTELWMAMAITEKMPKSMPIQVEGNLNAKTIAERS